MTSNGINGGLHPNGTDVLGPIQEGLCDRCQRLQLGPDSFTIRKLTTSSGRGRTAPLQMKSGGYHSNFATVEELTVTSEGCKLCDLLCRAISRYSRPHPADKDAVCSLTWEVDGRKSGGAKSSASVVNITRRLRFRWATPDSYPENEVYIILVAPSDPSRPATPGWHRQYQSFGRDDDPPERQELMKGWLDACCKHHDSGCNEFYGTEHEFARLVEQTYFGVIDVNDMRLTHLPMKRDGAPEAFVALSYVWGSQHGSRIANYATTRANVIERIDAHGLDSSWPSFPATIQDSILLVSKLGYRYLWVDALCIVQDSHNSWSLNAEAMHLVYGNAHFTICAADGDSSTGLRAARPIVRNFSERISTSTSGSSVMDSDQKGLADAPTLYADILPDVRLLVTRPLETVVNESTWNTRSWTFQERLLSRRCLIFAENRFYFQCRSIGLSQDIHTDGTGSGWELGQTNSPLRTLVELRERPMWFYLQCIRMYTGRQLTKQEDVINAFKGALWLLQYNMMTDIIFGLPASHLDFALLWQPSTRVIRRGQRKCQRDGTLCIKNSDRDCLCPLLNDASPGQNLPTWSWVGWTGGRIEYAQDMLQGCLGNVHDWLTNHTWIQWYIRDGKGCLTPLWNRLHHHARKYGRQGVQDAWRGYKYSFEPMRQPVRRHVNFDDQPAAHYNHWPTSDSDRSPSPVRISNSEYLARRRPHVYQESTSSAEETHRHQPSSRRVSDHTPSHDPVMNLRVGNISGSRDHEQGFSRHRSPRRSDYVPSYEYERVRIHRAENPSEPRVREQAFSRHRPSRRNDRAFAYYPVQDTPVENRLETRDRDIDNESISHDGREGGSQTARSDRYGRQLSSEVPQESDFQFISIIPDHPFGVSRYDTVTVPDEDVERYMPILQFFTWSTDLHVVIRKPDTRIDYSERSAIRKCDIVDKNGDWCGFLPVDRTIIDHRDGRLFLFIAISEAEAFTMEECPVWTYYVPQERSESKWDLYFVMMLMRNDERGLWERAGLGKVFQSAFMDKEWGEFKLG